MRILAKNPINSRLFTSSRLCYTFWGMLILCNFSAKFNLVICCNAEIIHRSEGSNSKKGDNLGSDLKDNYRGKISSGKRGIGIEEKTIKPNQAAERWAILIALDEYRFWPDLNSCVSDAKAVREVLCKNSSFDPERVWLLTMDSPSAHNHPYTAEAIYDRLKKFLHQTRPGDTVIIYFSGHGDFTNGQSYLIPYDARHKNNHVIPNDGLSTSSIRDLLEDYEICKAKHKLVILDACHSGGERSYTSTMARGFERTFASAETFVTISSCTEGQVSIEDPKIGHGVFTYYVMEALRGEADSNRDKKIDLMELYKYVEVNTRLYVSDKFNKEQTPKFMGKLVTVFDVGLQMTEQLRQVTRAPSAPNQNDLPEKFYLEADKSIQMILIKGARPFYIAKHEISQDQYSRFCDPNANPFPRNRYERSFGVPMDPDLPMVNITQDEAAAFCEFLGLQLPTSAQWIVAAESVLIPAKNPSRYAVPISDKRLSTSQEGVKGLPENVAEWCNEKGRCGGGSWNVAPSILIKESKHPYTDWIGFRPCCLPK